MIQIIKNIMLLSNINKKIFIYSTFFIFLSILDLIGFGLVGGFFSMLIDKSSSNNSIIIQTLSIFFGEFSLIQIGLSLILIYLFKDIMTFIINRSILLFANFSAHDLRIKLINNYQSQSFQDYVNSNSSKYIQSVTEYCYLYNVCLVGVLRLFSDIVLLFAVSIFFLFYFGYGVLYIFLFLIIAIFLYDRLFKNKIQLYGKDANLSNKQYIKNVNEIIRGFREIRIYSKEKYFNEVFNKSSFLYGLNRANAQIVSALPRYIIEFSAISTMIVLALFFYNNADTNTSSTLASLSVIAVATFRILPSFVTLATNFSQIRSNQHTFETLLDYVSLGEEKSHHTFKTLASTKTEIKSINLKDVSFKYDDKKIFENLNLSIKMGERILIKGPSGSGKTTLINLITGLLSPNEGAISINENFNANSKSILQSLTAYIPQQAFIIDDSIKNNIAFGQTSNEIDKEKINEAILRSHLNKLIESLPNGIDTIVGEDGSLISGGQKQRIALARAFYFDKKIIIMDESTNSLDKETEKNILMDVLNNSNKKIIILISHNNHDELNFDSHLIIENYIIKSLNSLEVVK